MGPKHLDRLTSIDTSFLAQEKDGSHMHIGGLLIFEGPVPDRDHVTRHIDSRLHLVPRYRQKLAYPRMEMGRPLWIDDPRFNIDYHVRQTALPSPGSEEDLVRLAARVFSQRLDRSKPLWELWVVEGLENGRFAVLSKVHHCLVDGVSGSDLTTVLFDVSPDQEDEPVEAHPWIPEPEPSDADLIAEGVKDLAAKPWELAGQLAEAVQRPTRTLTEIREGVEGVGDLAWSYINPAPTTPLNVPIGPHRNIQWLSYDLADFKRIKNALGGTVNDAFLTVVAGGLRRWLRTRGIRTDGLELRGCIPVSTRAPGEELGNRITAMFGPLPVYAADPVQRLRIVREAMSGLKEGKQALGAEVIAGLTDFAPPTIFAQASRLNFSTRFYNLLVTNVPGPQFPLYLRGRKLQQLIPIAFLAPNKALAVAIMSYDGKVTVSLISDYDAIPDLDEFGEDLADSLEELQEAARCAEAASSAPRVAGDEPVTAGVSNGNGAARD